jgi:hypothetical protein
MEELALQLTSDEHLPLGKEPAVEVIDQLAKLTKEIVDQFEARFVRTS